ncbi:MAG: membrane-bound PQQ-dependent dehydrogenase, glucose/quinate/shikimate family [Novosphingobium sp.]|nr:membrane-bound PQQ-dependent dehydrogenase, glucose/quinate/shikimate family [Novosphingobium sp.]
MALDSPDSGGTRARRRIVLAIVLTIIGLPLLGGGAYLLMLGGSPYYLLAGVAVLVSAFFAFRGSDRAIVVYVALLLATLIWALVESRNIWGVQARFLAPAVLGIWVIWPWLRKLPATVLAGGAAVVILGLGLPVYLAVRDHGSVSQTDFPQAVPAQTSNGEWRHYGNDLGGTKYSPLSQINVTNIGSLERAWTYHTGDEFTGNGVQNNPLMIGDTVYICTSSNQVHAIDAETGKRRWAFDPGIDPPMSGACRGVAYFRQPDATGACAARIISGTIDARLMALDAVTGKPCMDFGKDGFVDLKAGMGNVLPDYYYVSSAPVLVRGKVIVGGNVMDGQMTNEPSGVIRAYDAVTGAFAWAWDMDRPDEHGMPPEGKSFSRGTANSWAPMSGDEDLGLVYVPTGNGTPDYWGAHRSPGTEKYSSSVVAIDAETGAERWHFQTVHHDVWDYDIASQPTLIDLPVNGEKVPALLQPTKQGEIFLLDRRTGKPLAPVEEQSAPQGSMKGERLSSTQPISAGMPGFGRETLTESMMWGATPLDQLWCRIKFRQSRYQGMFTPPGMDWSIQYPGNVGGMNRGGISVDPENGLMVVDWLRLPIRVRLVTRAEADRLGFAPTTTGAVPHVGVENPQAGVAYGALLDPLFASPLEMPCLEPPYGNIAVVDLKTRKVIWQKPFGTSVDTGPFRVASHVPLPIGVPSFGGSLTTGGGLIFIGGSQEKRFRALDTSTGKQLWSRRLPAGGNANPTTYISPKSGRQFVVIAAGGSIVLGSGASDAFIAYALPKQVKQ